MNIHMLHCSTCRLHWWQCPARIKWAFLEILGEKLIQCHYHQDIDACVRRGEARIMLDFINKRKVELEKILEEEP
jgi:hypothetical protein